jgi:hypothetical protein
LEEPFGMQGWLIFIPGVFLMPSSSFQNWILASMASYQN